VPDRAALAGIVFVLKTGIPWEHLPGEIGRGSGSTCWRRLHDWQEAGVRFSGDIANIDSSRSVEGTTPAQFEQQVYSGSLAFDSVSATVQNAGGAGELRVEVVVDGEVVKESSTTAQYGVVSVNYAPGG